jgi:hypothetical protein
MNTAHFLVSPLNQNELLLGDGEGNFSNVQIDTDDGNSWAGTSGDFNGDGTIEIYVGSLNGQNHWWNNELVLEDFFNPNDTNNFVVNNFYFQYMKITNHEAKYLDLNNVFFAGLANIKDQYSLYITCVEGIIFITNENNISVENNYSSNLCLRGTEQEINSFLCFQRSNIVYQIRKDTEDGTDDEIKITLDITGDLLGIINCSTITIYEPDVISIVPRNEERNVSVNSKIKISFNVAMDPYGINYIEVRNKKGIVPGNWVVNNNKEFIFSPDDALGVHGENISIFAGESCLSQDKIPLPPHKFNFTVSTSETKIRIFPNNVNKGNFDNITIDTGKTNQYLRVEIFSFSGNIIRTLNDSSTEISQYNRFAFWDGKDDNNNEIEAGIYLVKIINSENYFDYPVLFDFIGNKFIGKIKINDN